MGFNGRQHMPAGGHRRGACFALLCLCALAPIIGCAKMPRSNPLDALGDSYVAPAIDFLGAPPADGIDTTGAVFLHWSGNDPRCQFRYGVNGATLSAWADVSRYYEFFDDGTHMIVVQARYPGGSDIAADTLRFTVAALDTPAVYLYPPFSYPTSFPWKGYIKTKNLPPAKLLHLEIAGGALASMGEYQQTSVHCGVRIEVDSPPTGSAAFFADNILDIIRGPGSPSIQGSELVLPVTITPIDTSRSYWAMAMRIVACVVEDSTGTAIPIRATRGAAAIRRSDRDQLATRGTILTRDSVMTRVHCGETE